MFFFAALVHAGLESNSATWNVETVFRAISENYQAFSSSWDSMGLPRGWCLGRLERISSADCLRKDSRKQI